MPIYEYDCNSCNKKFEALILKSEQPVCPLCNSSDVKKLMSMCGFVTKGIGGNSETVKSSASSTACGSCTTANCSSCGVV